MQKIFPDKVYLMHANSLSSLHFGAALHPKSASPADCLPAKSPEQMLAIADGCDTFVNQLETVEDGVDPLTVKFETGDGGAKATISSQLNGEIIVDRNDSYGPQYFLDTVLGETRRFAAALKSPTELEQEGLDAALYKIRKFTTQMASGELTHEHVDHEGDRMHIELLRDGETEWLVRQTGKREWKVAGNRNLIEISVNPQNEITCIGWEPLRGANDPKPLLHRLAYQPQEEKFLSPLAGFKERQWKEELSYPPSAHTRRRLKSVSPDLAMLNMPLEKGLAELALEGEQLVGQLKTLFDDVTRHEHEEELLASLEEDMASSVLKELEDSMGNAPDS